MILSYIDMVLNIIIGFYMVPLVIGYIGMSQYGLMRIILGVTAYAGLFQLGLTGTIARYTAKYIEEGRKEKIGELVWVNLLIYAFMAMLAFVAGIIVYSQFDTIFNIEAELIGQGKIAFIIAMVGAVLNIPSMILFALLHGHNQYAFFYSASIVKVIIRFGLTFLFLNLGCNVVTLFIIDYAMDILLRLTYLFFIMKRLKIRLVYKFDKAYVKKLFSFSGALFTIFIADMVFWRTDTVLLGIYTDTKNVAVYSVSQNLVNYFKMICETFSNVFLPTLTAIYVSSKNYLEKINQFFIKASRFQFVIVIAIVVNFIFLGTDFIRLWLGDEFIEAYKYTVILMLSMAIPMMQTTGMTILFTLNKLNLRAVIYISSAVINIFVTIYLIKIMGAMGAAIGTAAAMVVCNVFFNNFYYKHLLKLNIGSFFIKTTSGSLIAMIPTVLLHMALSSMLPGATFINFFAKAIICNIPFVLLSYHLTLTKHEREQLIQFLRKNIGRITGSRSREIG